MAPAAVARVYARSRGAPSVALGGPATLTRGAGTALAEQLAARYAERISQRLLLPGARLPSVRDCARRHGVSASTVVAAYDQLQAQGLVQALPQRGFYVRDAGDVGEPLADAHAATALATTPASRKAQRAAASAASARAASATAASRNPAPLVRPVDATALIRSMFQSQANQARAAGLPSPGLGTLPEDWLDAALLQRELRRVLAPTGERGEPSGSDWLRYGDPAGDAKLRAALALHLADLGIHAAPAQIVTTVGATHALELISRTLLKPGDAVLVDEPGWAVEFARLTRGGMRLLPVPRGPEGPDLAVMRRLLQEHRPRLFITVSVLHNPTGAMLAPSHAHQLLQLAKEHDLAIVEDDTYAWLAPPHATRMAQLDGLQRTIYVSGFSKIVAPQWRVGFLAAPPALAERFIDTKLLSTLTTPALFERAIAHCLLRGSLAQHAEQVRQRLTAARQRTVRLAHDAGFEFVTPPQGLFGWLDVGTDTEQLASPLLDAGWLTAPGSLFLATRQPSTLMRVNFASSQDPRFWRALKVLKAQSKGQPRSQGVGKPEVSSPPHRGQRINRV